MEKLLSYESLLIEVIEVKVENSFEASTRVLGWNNVEEW